VKGKKKDEENLHVGIRLVQKHYGGQELRARIRARELKSAPRDALRRIGNISGDHPGERRRVA
jgi:hypothetical protein